MKASMQLQVERAADLIIDAFKTNHDVKKRAVTKVVRRVLLDGPYDFDGNTWEVTVKSLGAGVYELSVVKSR